MPQQKTATLAAIFSEVLANLAFMFNDDEAADPSPGELWFETHIGYRGSERGMLYLRCTMEFASLLASNLLGVDPQDEDAEAKAIDSVKEFMNIVCGQLITTWYGDDEVFDLTIPETTALAETPELNVEDNDNLTTMSVEGHRVQLEFHEDQ